MSQTPLAPPVSPTSDPIADQAAAIAAGVDENITVTQLDPDGRTATQPVTVGRRRTLRQRVATWRRDKHGGFVSGPVTDSEVKAYRKAHPDQDDTPQPGSRDEPAAEPMVSQVIDPIGAGTNNTDAGAPPDTDQPDDVGEDVRVELGEPAGDLVADGLFKATRSWFGPRAEPTDSEDKATRSMLRRVFGGWLVHRWWALTVIVLLYMLRVMMTKGTATNGKDNAPLPGGDDQERQNTGGKGPQWVYAK